MATTQPTEAPLTTETVTRFTTETGTVYTLTITETPDGDYRYDRWARIESEDGTRSEYADSMDGAVPDPTDVQIGIRFRFRGILNTLRTSPIVSVEPTTTSRFVAAQEV